MLVVAEDQEEQDGSAPKSDWYFNVFAGSSKSDIWKWWRERRFRYNRDLFLVGAATWLLVLFAGSAAVKPGVDFEEPIAMIIGPLFFAILANLAYTCGPILDTIAYRGSPRKHLLKADYVSSVVLTALPGMRAFAAWLWTVATGVPKEVLFAPVLIDANRRSRRSVVLCFARLRRWLQCRFRLSVAGEVPEGILAMPEVPSALWLKTSRQ